MQAGSVGLIENKFSIIGVEFEISIEYLFEVNKKQMGILLSILQKILSKTVILKTPVCSIGYLSYGCELNWPNDVYSVRKEDLGQKPEEYYNLITNKREWESIKWEKVHM